MFEGLRPTAYRNTLKGSSVCSPLYIEGVDSEFRPEERTREQTRWESVFLRDATLRRWNGWSTRADVPRRRNWNGKIFSSEIRICKIFATSLLPPASPSLSFNYAILRASVCFAPLESSFVSPHVNTFSAALSHARVMIFHLFLCLSVACSPWFRGSAQFRPEAHTISLKEHAA